MDDVSSAAIDFVRRRMRTRECRKQNTIWHAGLELRQQAEAVNWNRFRSLKGRLTEGPDIDGSEFYAVTWLWEDGKKHSTYHEYEIKYEDLILNDNLLGVMREKPAQSAKSKLPPEGVLGIQ